MLSQEERGDESVKSLESKCMEMIKDAEEYDTVSLHTQANEVKDALNQLRAEFDKESYDVDRLKLLKATVDRRAIVLEYYLQTVCSKYKDTYAKRVLVEQLCRQVTGKVKDVALGRVEKDMILWAGFNKSVVKMKSRSLKLLFDLSKEELQLIEEIKKEL